MLEFSNLRTQLWWEFRCALDPNSNRGIALPPDDELLRDLTAPRFVIRGAKIYVDSLEDIMRRIGRSPDLATAYILALMDTPKRLVPRRREPRATEYDPYAGLATARDLYA